MKTKHFNNSALFKQKGISLVEIIVYIAILSIITTGLIRTVIVINETSSYLRAQERMTYSGTMVLETLTREIRKADAVNLFSSTLDVTPGTLVLDSTDDSGNPEDVTVTLSNGRVLIQKGLGAFIPLTLGSTYVENVTFKHFTNSNTNGVAVEMMISHQTTNGTTSTQFQTFTVIDK